MLSTQWDSWPVATVPMLYKTSSLPSVECAADLGGRHRALTKTGTFAINKTLAFYDDEFQASELPEEEKEE